MCCVLLLFHGLSPRKLRRLCSMLLWDVKLLLISSLSSSSAGQSRRTCTVDLSSSSQYWQAESSWLLKRPRLVLSLLCPVLSLKKILVMLRDLWEYRFSIPIFVLVWVLSLSLPLYSSLMFNFFRYSLNNTACSAEKCLCYRLLLGISWLLSSDADQSATWLPGLGCGLGSNIDWLCCLLTLSYLLWWVWHLWWVVSVSFFGDFIDCITDMESEKIC